MKKIITLIVFNLFTVIFIMGQDVSKIYNVDEFMTMVKQNPLRVKNKEFIISGIMNGMTHNSTDLMISLKRSGNWDNSFYLVFPFDEYPIQIKDLSPGDIINVKGKYRSPGMVDLLENCTIIKIDKKSSMELKEKYTGKQFFNEVIGSNFIWANGKTFTIAGEITSIDEFKGKINIYIKDDPFSSVFPFVFDNKWSDVILKLNIGDVAIIEGKFLIKSFSLLEDMGFDNCSIKAIYKQ